MWIPKYGVVKDTGASLFQLIPLLCGLSTAFVASLMFFRH